MKTKVDWRNQDAAIAATLYGGKAAADLSAKPILDWVHTANILRRLNATPEEKRQFRRLVEDLQRKAWEDLRKRIEAAVLKGDGKPLESLARVCVAAHKSASTEPDPLHAYLRSFLEIEGSGGIIDWVRNLSPTPKEAMPPKSETQEGTGNRTEAGTWKDVQKAVHSQSGIRYDERTIRRAAKAMGVPLKRGKPGAPKGKQQPRRE